VHKKALRILFNTFWDSTGWTMMDERFIPKEDFEYAKENGTMFDSLYITHDDAISRLHQIWEKINFQDVTNAFLSSLSTRRLEYRSALGSYIFANKLPKHKNIEGEGMCELCGIYGEGIKKYNLNVLNIERYKWGGVRHSDVIYALLDLEQFCKLEKFKPTDEDYSIFKSIIKTIKELDEKAKPRDVEKAISKLFKSNKAERDILISILGYCSILETPEHKGFLKYYTYFVDRQPPPQHFNDWSYPISWWKRKDCINKEAPQYFFPFLADDSN
jgi:hypothetical protein